MTAPLMPWRRSALVTIAVAVIGVAVGGIAFHSEDTLDGIDRSLLLWTRDHINRRFLSDALHITTPAAVTLLIAVVAVIAWVKGHRRLAVTAALGPTIALVLTEAVIKPIVDRHVPNLPWLPPVSGTEAYPSGHETGLSSLMTVLVLVVFAITASTLWRLVAIGAALAVSLLGCLVLVGNYYHFATDTFAAIGVSIAAILGVALVLDSRAGRRVSSPDAGTPASTAHAA